MKIRHACSAPANPGILELSQAIGKVIGVGTHSTPKL